MSEMGLDDIIASIQKAKENDDIKGIYIEGGIASFDAPATAQQVRDALLDFKTSGKWIIAYADQYMQGSYYVATVADKIYLNSQGMIDFKGLGGKGEYYKGLYDKLGINEGMFFENSVAQALTARGVDLLFYSVKDARHPERTMEIDFLFRNGIKICPVEVKSSRCREHASLDRFVKAHAKRLGPCYVITSTGYFREGGIEYVPIYMAHLIAGTSGVLPLNLSSTATDKMATVSTCLC
jgi:hypothetical protein